MTEANHFSLDPVLLESCGIIRQSRSGWSGVVTALDRLGTLQQTRDPYNEMESDRDDVLEYANVVQRSGDVIAYAASMAVHLTRFAASGSTPQKRFSDGLRVLSEGLALRQLDEAQTRSELLRCMRELFPNEKLPFEPWKADEQIDTDWAATLQSLLDRTYALPPPTDFRKRAWERWQARLLGAIRGTGEVPADLDYLRCRAEDSSPGTILPVDLNSLLLHEWSAAYVRSMSTVSDSKNFCPMWFAYGVLCAVGFDTGPDLVSATPTRPGDREELETTRRFLQQVGATTAPRKGTIVVKAKAGSLTNTWMAVRTMPALCLTVDEFTRSYRVNLAPYFTSRLHGLLVEVEPTDSTEDVKRRVNQLRDALSVGRVVLIARAARTDLPSYPMIVNPHDLSTAVSQAFEAPVS